MSTLCFYVTCLEVGIISFSASRLEYPFSVLVPLVGIGLGNVGKECSLGFP